nr:MAG TPA: hypothetical protein [Caudoviricetes sp.]
MMIVITTIKTCRPFILAKTLFILFNAVSPVSFKKLSFSPFSRRRVIKPLPVSRHAGQSFRNFFRCAQIDKPANRRLKNQITGQILFSGHSFTIQGHQFYFKFRTKSQIIKQQVVIRCRFNLKYAQSRPGRPLFNCGPAAAFDTGRCQQKRFRRFAGQINSFESGLYDKLAHLFCFHYNPP